MENDSVSTSAPYFFYFIGEVGVTVVRASEFKQHVFGADIAVSALSESLKENPISPSSEMFIVTDDGGVVASRRDYRPTSKDESTPGILAFKEVKQPVVQDYLAWKAANLDVANADG
ncbi:cache domain-containing protein, partial [Pararhodobacter sp. CCB-MM2]